jgi:hypothetical protein
MKAKLLSGVSIFLLASFVVVAQQTEPEPELLELDLYFRHAYWVMSPPISDDAESPGAPDFSQAVFLSVFQAIDPRTHHPLTNTPTTFGCDPAELRQLFRLEKKEFLLGEPILVEHRIELNGEGKWWWSTGGNYRARGRDDNLTVIMRRTDSDSFVPDPYPPLDGLIMGGGLGSSHEITEGKPLSEWFGVQRYAAITEPGTYDLYCLGHYQRRRVGDIEAMTAALPEEIARDYSFDERGALIDSRTGKPSERYQVAEHEHLIDADSSPSPLLKLLPPEVAEQVGNMPLGVMAHFRIVVRQGTRAERREMVEKWIKIAETSKPQKISRPYKSAAQESIWFARQNDFLPAINQWIAAGRGDNVYYMSGLAVRPDQEGLTLLLKLAPSDQVNAMYNLHPDRIADAIPVCIELLTTTSDETVRWQAESLLKRWTGQSFAHPWQGDHYRPPTPAEAHSMQSLWREWWKKNKSSFKPVKAA